MRKQTTPLSESQIQHDCLTWFRLQYPNLALLLFAVPNGGRRDAKTGARMKYEGVVRGVTGRKNGREKPRSTGIGMWSAVPFLNL